MGNSNGSLADYWKVIESHSGLQGGFIWEWMDHGFAAAAYNGQKYWKYGGDFGDEPSDYDFCCDGLLFPDQTPKPALAECKQVFSPVKLFPIAGKLFSFFVENRFDFSNLDNVELRWYLRTESKTLTQGNMGLPAAAPWKRAEITLPVSEATVQEWSGILYIHIDFCLKTATPWAEAGFIIGSGEKTLRERSPELFMQEFIKSDHNTFFERIFRWKPSLFRVPTQNDGLKTYGRFYKNPSAEFYWRNKAMYPWLEMDLLNMRCVRENNKFGVWHGYDAACYSAELLTGEGAIPAYKDKKLGNYTCITVPATNEHPLIMDIIFDLDMNLPELPKIGVCTVIPASYDKIRWFGRGPHEAYSDRCESAFLGLYEGTIAELETPYIMPQENGNRYDVRQITLFGENAEKGQASSVTIQPDAPVNMSVSRYTQKNMWDALHLFDLVDTIAGGGYYTLNIDIAQRGVGTATCGPDTLEQYRVRGGVYRMRLIIG
jgi:beta-galactosidase